MKRILSFTLLLTMIFSICLSTLVVSSKSASNEVTGDSQNSKKYLSFTCTYDEKSKNIVIKGTMMHEAFADYKNSKLLIFAVSPGMSEEHVANAVNSKPLVEADVSLDFGFIIKTNGVMNRYSRYAIFLRSNDGELILAADAQYPSLDITFEKGSTGFKGISTDMATLAAEIGTGITVIPVYLDRLFTENTSGYAYTVDGKQMFLDRGYVNEIDAKINSLSVSNTKIYLQLLLKNTGEVSGELLEQVKFIMPNMREELSILTVHAATAFLVSRYQEEGSADVDGIIMGKGWNAPSTYNYCNYGELTEYVELCGLYAAVVSNAARSVSTSLDVVIPLCSDGFAEENSLFAPFLKALFKYLDASFSSGLECSIMMESEEVPFDISNLTIDGGADLDFKNYNSNIYPGGQRGFSEYLKTLAEKYVSVPDNYIFCWNIPEELFGNALEASYVYSYYALVCDPAVSAFVAEPSGADQLSDLMNVAKYIDTNKNIEKTERLLSYFGATEWKNIKGISQNPVNAQRSIYTANVVSALPDSIVGEFGYFDFSKSISINGWSKGSGCNNLRLDYAQSTLRALKAELLMNSSEKSEVVYLYEYYENISYTQYLGFDLQINDGVEDSLYEIEISFDSQESRAESSCVVRGDELTKVVLDMSGYGNSTKIKNIKVSARCIYGDVDSCTMWLYDIKGYSDKYDSATIAEHVEKERAKANITDKEEQAKIEIDRVSITIGVLIIIVSLGFGLFVILKKNTKNKPDEE